MTPARKPRGLEDPFVVQTDSECGVHMELAAADSRRRTRLRPIPRTYAASQQDYLDSGLGTPLPLPYAQKMAPPKGFIGRQAKVPSRRRLASWRDNRAAGNVALRLAPDVLGIDVDAYGDKIGQETLELALASWGPLPDTVRSTSRRDGISGIYLFRVPMGLTWWGHLPADLVSGVTGHVDLIHHHLRYLVAPPSLHAEGRVYRWRDADGVLLDIPNCEDLPELPDAWRGALSRPAPVMLPPRPRGAAGGASSQGETQPDPAGDLLGRQAARVRAAVVGERNKALLTAATHCGGDPWQDKDESQLVLVAAAQSAGLTKREALATFDSGWHYGRGR